MSLGIAIKGPEGIVLAAESRITLTGQARAAGAPVLQVSFDNATKVLSFSEPNTAVGAVTYGVAAIGFRSAYSFLPEFETTLPTERVSIGDFAERLGRFYHEQWEATKSKPPPGPGMTFVVAGFDEGEAYGRVYLVEVPGAPGPAEQSPEPAEFAITWGGQREFVDRLVQGYDERVVQAARDVGGLDEEKTKALDERLAQLRMAIPLEAMPLQDCVDLAVFFIRTTIDAQRLTLGIRGCGGAIDVATITRSEGFQFVQRKRIRGESVRVR